MGLFSGKCESVRRLDGKTAVITGCNTGIGKETVKDFFIRGARVIMACRNVEKAKAAAKEILKECQGLNSVGEIVVKEMNLMSLRSIKTCAVDILNNEEYVHLLINNAGIMICPEGRSEDGFETQFGTNHLGHFYFTMLLLPKICQSTPARIVNLSSIAHYLSNLHFDDLNWTKRPYNAVRAYQQSKLANILFTQELARRINDAGVKGVNVYSLHPGVIDTELFRHTGTTFFPALMWIWNNIAGHFIKTPLQGAQTTIYCAVSEECDNQTGLYYVDCAVATPGANARNKPEEGRRLWEESLKLVGLPSNFNPFPRRESQRLQVQSSL